MRIIILILLLLSTPAAWGAAITSAQSGSWSATSTWAGGVVPDPAADTVTIASGHTVTLSDSRSIPTTTVAGSLTQGAGVTTTLSGTLTIGNGASKDGTLTFGAGSTLALGANNLVLNNCTLRSNATSGSWAVITGSGSITMGAVYSAPKQDVSISYVSHQNTGTVAYAAGGGSGGGVNALDIQHNVFHGPSTVTFGQSGWTPAALAYTIQYNDFVDVGDPATASGVVITGAAGTATTYFRYNTLRSALKVGVRINNRSGATVSNNVFYNVALLYHGSNTSTTGGHTISGNFFSRPDTETNAGMVVSYNAAAANTYSGNYFYEPQTNPHTFSTSGTGGTGTVQITGNVFETVYNTDQGNHVSTGNSLNYNITGNLLIGSGALAYPGASVTVGGTVNIKNNTIFITQNNGDVGGGHLWMSETTMSFSGTINAASNLMAYKSGVSPNPSASYFIGDISTAGNQAIASSDFNAIPNGLSSAYYRVSVASGQTHDLYGTAPQFTAPDRALATWGVSAGADGTAVGAVNKLLATNGYNAGSQTQSDPAASVTVPDLVTWVRSGFTPTSAALKGTGEGGADIGAVAVQVASSFAINGQRYSTWNGRTPATWNGAAQ